MVLFSSSKMRETSSEVVVFLNLWMTVKPNTFPLAHTQFGFLPETIMFSTTCSLWIILISSVHILTDQEGHNGPLKVLLCVHLLRLFFVCLCSFFVFVLFFLSSGSRCLRAFHFRSLEHLEWAENSLTINHIEYTREPSLYLACPFYLIALFYNGRVLMTSMVRETVGGGWLLEWKSGRKTRGLLGM